MANKSKITKKVSPSSDAFSLDIILFSPAPTGPSREHPAYPDRQ